MLALTASNSSGDGTFALVMAINTTGFGSVNLGYDLVVANASTSQRGAGMVVQYRVGNSGTWTTIDSSYFISKSAPPPIGTVTSYDYALATEALDQPHVEIRWIGYYEYAGGFYTSIGIDNIAVTAVPESATSALLVGLLALAAMVGWRQCGRLRRV